MAWFLPQTSGGGVGFTLGPVQNVFTGANRAAAEAARDAYAVDPANSAWLPQYNADTSLNIRLEYSDGTNSLATYQVRNEGGTGWLDNQSFTAIQGQPGQDGAGTDFSGISTNHIPAIGSDDRPFDSGLIVDENGDIVTPGSIQTGPGSVRIGPGFSISNGVQTMALDKSTGQKALAVITEYDDTGSTKPFYYSLAAEQTLNVNLLSDIVITAPYELTYTTFGDNLTNDFTFIPNEAGDIRLRYWLGTDDTGMLIFDETRTVTAGEVGNPTMFGVGNPYLIAQGTQLFVRSEGVDLRGTLVDDSASPFDGQNLLYFRSVIQPYTLIDFADDADLIESLGLSVSGDMLTITASRVGSQPDLTATVTLPSTGGGTAPVDTSAQITRFEIQGQATSVLAGTTLAGTKTFNFNVNHPEDVSGNLELRQGTAVLRNDIDPNTNTFDQLITDATLGNNQQAIFQLRGETNEGILLSSFFRIRAHLPAEQLFYGLSSSDNPADVDTATLEHIEAGIDRSTISTGTTAAGDYFIVLAPNDHDLSSIIDGLGQDVTSIFTRTPDVRTLNSVLYTSYVFGPVNAGASESYTVRF